MWLGPAPFTVLVFLLPKNKNTTPNTHFKHFLFSMRHSALRIVRRGLATAAAHPPHAGSSSTSHVTAATSAIPLSNVEAQWATLSPSEQTAVHQQLEELQRKDWKTLSLAEKKAGTSSSYLIPHAITLFSSCLLVGGFAMCFPSHILVLSFSRSSLLCRVWSAWPSCAD